MSSRLPFVFALVGAMLLGAWLSRMAAPWFAPAAAPTSAGAKAEDPAKGSETLIRLGDAQIEAAKITTERVSAGVLRRKIAVPALVTPDPEHVGHVAAKVAGTIEALLKRLGDPVAKGEVVARIESREVADAKSEYLAALANFDLQTALFRREKGLYEKQITAEQLFLKARQVYTEAKLRFDVARQKLLSLDLSDEEIAGLPSQPPASLRLKLIRAPLSGRVTDRMVSLGQPVGGEGQAKEIYVVSDLSEVEADLSVPVSDLRFVKERQTVAIVTPEGKEIVGDVAYVNAMLTPETRAGHVIARFPNKGFALRPGSLLEAHIVLEESRAGALAPRLAVQTIANRPVVFLRTPEGFEKRVVEIGAKDDDSVEITSGLKPGDVVAVANSFVLKAELGKNDIPEE